MDIKKRLEETAKGQIDLHIGGAAGKGSLTRFGGAPDLPEGFEWPRYGYGDETPLPLAFLAQFDCRKLAKHDTDGLLPHEGVISFFYELFRDNFVVSSLLSGMQAGVGAVIASTVWNMGGGVVKQKDPANLLIMAAAFVAACVYRVNVVYIILTCIAIGIVRTVIAQRRNGK